MRERAVAHRGGGAAARQAVEFERFLHALADEARVVADGVLVAALGAGLADGNLAFDRAHARGDAGVHLLGIGGVLERVRQVLRVAARDHGRDQLLAVRPRERRGRRTGNVVSAESRTRRDAHDFHARLRRDFDAAYDDVVEGAVFDHPFAVHQMGFAFQPAAQRVRFFFVESDIDVARRILAVLLRVHELVFLDVGERGAVDGVVEAEPDRAVGLFLARGAHVAVRARSRGEDHVAVLLVVLAVLPLDFAAHVGARHGQRRLVFQRARHERDHVFFVAFPFAFGAQFFTVHGEGAAEVSALAECHGAQAAAVDRRFRAGGRGTAVVVRRAFPGGLRRVASAEDRLIEVVFLDAEQRRHERFDRVLPCDADVAERILRRVASAVRFLVDAGPQEHARRHFCLDAVGEQEVRNFVLTERRIEIVPGLRQLVPDILQDRFPSHRAVVVVDPVPEHVLALAAVVALVVLFRRREARVTLAEHQAHAVLVPPHDAVHRVGQSHVGDAAFVHLVEDLFDLARFVFRQCARSEEHRAGHALLHAARSRTPDVDDARKVGGQVERPARDFRHRQFLRRRHALQVAAERAEGLFFGREDADVFEGARAIRRRADARVFGRARLPRLLADGGFHLVLREFPTLLVHALQELDDRFVGDGVHEFFLHLPAEGVVEVHVR